MSKHKPPAYSKATGNRFQILVIILTDQHLAESYVTADRFDLSRVRLERFLSTNISIGGEPYRRYHLTPDGVSPQIIPGTPGAAVTLDSDKHDEDGRIIEDLATRRMVEKRMGKLSAMTTAGQQPEITGDAAAR